MKMRLIDANALMEYCNNLKDKTIDANDIARFPTAVGWISVKDRMPELHHITSYSRYETFEYDISDPVLVATYEGVFIARYEVDNETEQYWIDSISEKITVTHWMPLPTMPEEEDG